MRCLAGVWHARDALGDDASAVTERAGVGYAALLALADSDDTEPDPADVLDALPDDTDDQPAAVRAVAAALTDHDTASDSLGALETLAYTDLLEELTPTPRDDYETALRRIARNGDAQTVLATLRDVWEYRDDIDAASAEYEAVLAAGVLLVAHAPVVDPDAVDVDPEVVRETVAPHRDRLSESMRTLFDLLRGERDAVDSDELRAAVDTDGDDDLDVADLETLVVARLADVLQSAHPAFRERVSLCGL